MQELSSEYINQLEQKLSALQDQLSKKDNQIATLENKVISLEEKLLWFRRREFGKKSEKFLADDPNQLKLDLFPDELTPSQKRDIEKEAAKEEDYLSKTIKVKKRENRKEISSENLRVEEVVIEPEGINIEDYVRIGEEITSELVYISAEVIIRRTNRPKYARKDQSGIDDKKSIAIALLPKAPIHKCMADSSLLTEIFIQKYLYHIPFHRQILRFRELGVNISSSTIGDWFSCTCELLKPLYDKLKEQVLKSDYIQIDETTLPVIDNEKRDRKSVV